MTYVLFFAIACERPDIRWVDDEPKAVIAAIEDGSVTESELVAIFATEGYKRLKARELGMGREFTDEGFSTYVRGLTLDITSTKTTLAAWSKLDFSALGSKAARYLPEAARIKASVYPLIKPRPNSFVWDVQDDPAIMLYLDTKLKPEEVALTVTHELHHIGYAASCPSNAFKAWQESLPVSKQAAWTWVGAFGEGYAVLAAAQDRKDPVAPMSPEVRASFDDGMSHLRRDMDAVSQFLLDTASGKLSPEAAQTKAMEFFGVQGPWYTLGFAMATTIEDTFGKGRLIECYVDPRRLFETYNLAARKHGPARPQWPDELIRALGAN